VAGTAVKLGAAGALFATVLVAQNRDEATPRALADTVGYVRVAHLSPDTAPFDFLVTQDGQKTPTVVLRGVKYGDISQYQRLAPGSYTVVLRGTGAGERGITLLTEPLQVDSGKAYTLTATGMRAELSMRVVGDDIQPARGGQVRLRVFNAASRIDPAEVDIDAGVVLWEKVGFGTVSSYTTVAPGRHSLQIFAPGRDDPAATLSTTLAANGVYSLTILDTADGAKLQLQTDAAAPPAPPRGSVETGYGGAYLNPFTAVPPRTPPPRVPAGLLPGPRPGLAAVRPVPVELAIARIGVHARIGALHLNRASALVPPANPAAVGWYAEGILPGQPGPAVLAGHVDGPGGPAVFWRLGLLRAGDGVAVRTAAGTVLHYRVLTVKRYPKGAFPAGAVYAATPDSELRLITCGGAFDAARHSYLDNVVVSAVPA
jgi:uncharacterized protein DUF4397/sortase family protein